MTENGSSKTFEFSGTVVAVTSIVLVNFDEHIPYFRGLIAYELLRSFPPWKRRSFLRGVRVTGRAEIQEDVTDLCPIQDVSFPKYTMANAKEPRTAWERLQCWRAFRRWRRRRAKDREETARLAEARLEMRIEAMQRQA